MNLLAFADQTKGENLLLLTVAYRWVNPLWVKGLTKNTSYEVGKCKGLIKKKKKKKHEQKPLNDSSIYLEQQDQNWHSFIPAANLLPMNYSGTDFSPNV